MLLPGSFMERIHDINFIFQFYYELKTHRNESSKKTELIL